MMNFLEANTIRFESRHNNFAAELKEYLSDINADFCLLFSIKGCKVKKILHVVNEDSKLSDLDFQNMYIDVYSNYIINNMFNERKAIISEEQENSLVKGVKIEIYIPVIKDTELIGFVYIGSLNEKVITLNIKNLNEIMNKYILEFFNIEKKVLSNEVLYKTITFVHEIFKNKSEYMIRHNYNVATWAISIAKKMNFPEKKVFNIWNC